MSDLFWRILCFGRFIPLFACFIISPAVFVWWFFNNESRDRFNKRHAKLSGAIYIGAFLSLMFVLDQGIEELLVFIPSHWGGYDEDGEFVTTRSWTTHFLAMLAVFFFAYVFNSFEKMRKENRRLKAVAEIRYMSMDSLIQKQNKIQSELERLGSYEGQPSADDEAEIRMLYKLLEEIEYRKQMTERSDSLDEE